MNFFRKLRYLWKQRKWQKEEDYEKARRRKWKDELYKKWFDQGPIKEYGEKLLAREEKIKEVLKEHDISPLLMAMYPDWADRVRYDADCADIPWVIFHTFLEFLWETDFQYDQKDLYGRVR